MSLTSLLLIAYISVGATNIILFSVMIIKQMIKEIKEKKVKKNDISKY